MEIAQRREENEVILLLVSYICEVGILMCEVKQY